MISLNKLSKQTLDCAKKRGLVNAGTQVLNWAKAMHGEVAELQTAALTWCVSQHSSTNGRIDEPSARSKMKLELADVVITCMSFAAQYNINLEKAIKDKIDFNNNTKLFGYVKSIKAIKDKIDFNNNRDD